MELLDSIKDRCLSIQPCGSRVTCNPPPIDTDEDYLILVSSIIDFSNSLDFSIWELGGSAIPSEDNILPAEARFLSFTANPNINIIVTESQIFFDRFMLATNVCTKLNVLNKEHRITIFQAILYGNFYVAAPSEIDLLMI